ncbi:universal stress protein [Aequorivita lipolytica]|uniref:Universal stress protein n=1 Tax=Aequorivita lipolytica TaxID=153267 RepID=A0A5C6YRG0_9FLAO|nr:universal stress protein [Aequorivita lipolytica]TXD69516.1 universal stress protein [Aequorivita lipolytica]SRX50995.1 TRAP-T-associated universal stress protein TeaD [Aequorivita lipolytica]
MRKILIPTDFSENSLNAIKYATELFKHGYAEIYLLHAFADEVYDAKTRLAHEIFDELQQKTLDRTKEALENFSEKILAFSPNPKHKLHTIAEFGLLVDSVNDWVEKENIDVVVMGTKGKTDDKKITFGSNTLQVIKYVKCPVLAIPEVYGDVHPKNILFPTDYQLPHKRRELKLVSSIAKCFASRINFFYVSKFPSLSLRQQDNKTFLEAVFCENQINFHHEEGKDITKAINTFIIENPIDMLVMVNTRHSYLENILYQSTVEKIGLHIDIPFLVLQNLPR